MIWLGLAGTLTWQRSRESVLPPLWDQQTYVQKANAVWASIAKGTGENVLNIEPSVRPPGTVLLTAPLGQLKDHRNFYFRSVFIPVVLMAIAVFIAGVGVTRQRWESAIVALLAASMSMFWQFEGGISLKASGLFEYSWGLVDTFQASLAALAMATFLVAAVRFERVWIVPALVELALLPLIKPSGFVVGGLISLAWLTVAVRFAGIHPQGHARGRSGIVRTTIAIVLVLGGVALACFGSDYFSITNIEYGKIALNQLKGDWLDQDVAHGFANLFKASFGIPVMVATIALGGMTFVRRKKDIDTELEMKVSWMAAIGLLIISAGVIATYQATLFRQARYFFPVATVAMVLIVPILVIWSKQAGKLISTGVTIIPVSLLIFLASPKLNVLAYRFGGYDLSTGLGRKEVKSAELFVDKFRVTNTGSPQLFTLAEPLNQNDIGIYAFEAGFYHSLLDAGLSDSEVSQFISRPFNWESDAVVKINSIYNSDVVLIARQALIPGTPETFQQEVQAWNAWLSTTPASGSTEVLLETPSMLALAVRDKPLLEVQMKKFIASRQWRPEFINANRRNEFAPAELQKLHLSNLQVADPIDFGHDVRVYALSITRAPGKPKINMSVFSEIVSKNYASKYEFFIHQLNEKGEIISGHTVPLRFSQIAKRPLIRDLYSLDLDPKTVQLGVGIFEITRGALVSSWPLAKDWGGRRAKFNIKTLAATTHSEGNP